ncbi:hypothetical protein ZWY2020_037497 [Hordeum vulgare]|nr:hypothetical protein ZWY2020_037497 [Hordeum vulgare]
MKDPIYDAVAENYAALVARRREDADAFIINDDGLGYVDDGREEDWTHRALSSSFDEGSGGEDGAPRKRTASYTALVAVAWKAGLQACVLVKIIIWRYSVDI